MGASKSVIHESIGDVVTLSLSEGAIINDMHPGFRDDYLVLHCLIRECKPRRVFEIGTHLGVGTKIIKNAWTDADVISLDLAPAQASLSANHPEWCKSGAVGSYCPFPYTQVFGDSRSYDYSQHLPIDAWFIDAGHTRENVRIESLVAFGSGARLIVWHDADMQEVWDGITDAWIKTDEYELIRVDSCRIAYARKVG